MRKNKGIIIELTALLDVILIMLFWLMMNMKTESDRVRSRAEEQVAEANQSADEARDELEALRQQFDEYIEKHSEITDAMAQSAISDFADGRLITLNLKYDAVGKLYIMDGDAEFDRLLPESREQIAESLNALLSDRDDEGVVLCAFVYDGDRALYRDVRTISEAIDDVEKEHGGFFCTFINLSK